MSDEKTSISDGQGNTPTLRQKKRPFNLLSLFLCIIVATAWFTRSRYLFSPLSIEERVENILSQTPLIGTEIDENNSLCTIMTDALEQTVTMTFLSWSGNFSTTA